MQEYLTFNINATTLKYMFNVNNENMIIKEILSPAQKIEKFIKITKESLASSKKSLKIKIKLHAIYIKKLTRLKQLEKTEKLGLSDLIFDYKDNIKKMKKYILGGKRDIKNYERILKLKPAQLIKKINDQEKLAKNLFDYAKSTMYNHPIEWNAFSSTSSSLIMFQK